MTTDPHPAGLIGLTHVHGEVGKFIEFGQWMNGDGFRSWEHAFVSLGNGLLIQAEPGGAKVAHVEMYPVIHWCENIAAQYTAEQLLVVADAAKHYIGVPYSFLDYGALAVHRLRIPVPGLKHYVADTGHMICSQLADQAYHDAGLPLFKDGRWPGYVTPLAIYNLDISLEPK